MEILTIINKILDLKIVQWALLISLTTSLIFIIFLEIKVGTLKVEKAYYETEYAKVSSGLATQNEAVEELGRKTDEQKKNLEQAAKTASKIALEREKTLQGILGSSFYGTCDQKVLQALEMARGKK